MSAIYIPYQASCQQNLHRLTRPPEKPCTSKKISSAMFNTDESICVKFIEKFKSSHCFSYTIIWNRGLNKLFSVEKTDPGVANDLLNSYQIGTNSLRDYISHRILLKPSTLAPVHRNQLKVFTVTKIVKSKIRKIDQDQNIIDLCMNQQIAYSIKSGEAIKKFEQFIPLPRAICNADGSMYHTQTKSYMTKLFKKDMKKKTSFELLFLVAGPLT